ncbi:MAG: PP2C family protein-serine/threonine phosphatase [Thermoanaerobaculia bacterium]|nr:PP2C family protein-serine/threonine phosphatase [Thermoanaerobaculia bacterium]
MNDLKRLTPWLLVGIAGVISLVVLFDRVYPLYPRHWTIDGGQAEAIALEALRTLGDPQPGSYVTVAPETDSTLERRLLLARSTAESESIEDSKIARRVFSWRVSVYPPGAPVADWSHRAGISFDGRVLRLRRQIKADVEAPPIDPAVALERSASFLRELGYDLTHYDAPVVNSREGRVRRDLVLRYRSTEAVLGDNLPYGLEVTFAGDQLAGLEPYLDESDRSAVSAAFQSVALFSQLNFLVMFIVAPFVGVLFLRRYHAGEIGVSKGLRVFFAILGAGALCLPLIAPGMTENWGFSLFSRRQVTWVWLTQFVFVFFLPMATTAFFSWSVGESLCRERWSAKLAAFDSLYQRNWRNATVARASFRGFSAGLGMAGAVLALLAVLAPAGVSTLSSFVTDGFWFYGPLPGLMLLALAFAITTYRELVGRLVLLPFLSNRLGLIPGAALAAVLAGSVLFPSFSLMPLSWALVCWVFTSTLLVLLFLRYDFLTALLAGLTLDIALPAVFLIRSGNAGIEIQGWLVFLVVALPMLLSLRYLLSGKEFVYRYDDIPPHVRRIAERERQRVELETARRIQSSILPELPPRIAGMDIAHAYLPASEVGGDFYDVLALDDGRLAIAIGDVAGHGVSSGLVMSGAKSALAVQVTFNPEVLAVFETLNRMVYQSARKRLITTLCYALVDPLRREMTFASAGHLYPYVVSQDGRVRALQSTAYPLGVRPELEIAVTKESLEAGDTLVMLSDGIVEAHPENSPEPFGFPRIEKTLSILAQETVDKVRDGLLSELERYVGPVPREDDQTLLVLRIP